MQSHQDTDSFGRTALHYACADDDPQLCRRLLSEGADPNAKDRDSWTPLHFAAQASSLELVDLLLTSGADHRLCDCHGNTPLARAVFSSRGEGAVIARLLKAGADPHIENKHGISPLKLAQSIGNYNVAQFFDGIAAG